MSWEWSQPWKVIYPEWSSQTEKLQRADVPLPLLAMLHVYDQENPEELNGS